MTRTLLLAAIDLPARLDGEFHDWYDTEHIPERLAVSGMELITRWERVSGTAPRWLALFEAASRSVLDSGPYVALKELGDTPWTARLKRHFERVVRGIFDEVASFGPGGSAAGCVIAWTSVPADDEEAYRRWYDEEHGPTIAAVPGVLRLRRLEQAGDAVPRHVTLIELADLDALTGEAYGAAKAATPDPGLRDRWEREQGLYRLWRRYACGS
jgi:hypothetical protein